MKILIADDDPQLVRALRITLAAHGYDVVAAADGAAAITLAAHAHPDIVLLDWMVEGISGLEVCRRLRRSPETQNVPIIMLTARGEEEDRVRGLETGADDYVTKPFSPRELASRVAAVLARSGE